MIKLPDDTLLDKYEERIYLFQRVLKVEDNKLFILSYKFPNKYCINDCFILGESYRDIHSNKVKCFNEVKTILQEVEKDINLQINKEYRFYFDAQIDNWDLGIDRIEFEQCSTELIIKLVDLISQQCPIQSIKLVKNAINDDDFIQLVKLTQNNYEEKYFCSEWELESCFQISFQGIKVFSSTTIKQTQKDESQLKKGQNEITNNKKPQDTIYKIPNLSLAISDITFLTFKDFVKIATFENFKFISSLSIKNIKCINAQKIIQTIVEGKGQDRKNSENLFHSSNLTKLELDSSVCDRFDEIPIYRDWYRKLEEVQFEYLNKQNKPVITLEKQKYFSLPNLIKLSLINCNLPNQFFLNLAKKSYLNTLESLNISRCDFNPQHLSYFLQFTNLPSLKHLNFYKTQVDDQVCYTLSSKYCSKDQILSIDVSKNRSNVNYLDNNLKIQFYQYKQELTHKGLKYLTLIVSLQQLIVSSCPRAVSDTFAGYLVDLMKSIQIQILKK